MASGTFHKIDFVHVWTYILGFMGGGLEYSVPRAPPHTHTHNHHHHHHHHHGAYLEHNLKNPTSYSELTWQEDEEWDHKLHDVIA